MRSLPQLNIVTEVLIVSACRRTRKLAPTVHILRLFDYAVQVLS